MQCSIETDQHRAVPPAHVRFALSPTPTRAARPSASGSAAGPSASRLLQHPATTLIGGRLFEVRSLLPVDVTDYNAPRDSRFKRALLKETLACLLIPPLINIVADYSCASRSRQFAEELYEELWEGRTDLLYGELFDVERGVLKEPHHFWDYLGGGAERAVVFVHMLSEVQKRHAKLTEGLQRFAFLVSKGVPRAAHFIVCYLDGSIPFSLRNASLDEWPRALLHGQDCFKSCVYFPLEATRRIYYLLIQSNGEQLKKSVETMYLEPKEWHYVLRTLYGLEPALLSKFFAICFSKEAASASMLSKILEKAMSRELTLVRAVFLAMLYSVLCTWLGINGGSEPFAKFAGPIVLFLNMRLIMSDMPRELPIKQSLFQRVAPVAMSIDPTLGSVLIAIANENGWAEPVAAQLAMGAELVDGECAGGSVHMRSLVPVAQGLSECIPEMSYAASPTGKAVSSGGMQMHIAADNVLCALSKYGAGYLSIRRFQGHKVDRYPLAYRYPIRVPVQHGDVLVVHARGECPSFLHAKADCTGLSREGCFEFVKSFCHSAKDDDISFMAIVEDDAAGELKESVVKVEQAGGKTCSRKRKERACRPRERIEDGRRGKSLATTRSRHWQIGRALDVLKTSCSRRREEMAVDSRAGTRHFWRRP